MIHGFNVERFNHFSGKVQALVETLGLPKSQEDAFRSLLKQEIWDLWEHPAFIEEKSYPSAAVTI